MVPGVHARTQARQGICKRILRTYGGRRFTSQPPCAQVERRATRNQTLKVMRVAAPKEKVERSSVGWALTTDNRPSDVAIAPASIRLNFCPGRNGTARRVWIPGDATSLIGNPPRAGAVARECSPCWWS